VEATALTVLAGVVFAASAVFLRQRANKGSGKNRGCSGKPVAESKRNVNGRINSRNVYAALSIEPGYNPCEAAQHIVGERYLVNEAPKLPLPGCNPAHCNCSFTEHDDRRESHEDRRNPYGSALTTQLFEAKGESNRRIRRRGRRKTDWA
jgi:hypothetical protein